MTLSKSFVSNIQTCHACSFRQTNCQGSCPCQIDGVDVIEHAHQHTCPLERFESRGLGDTVARVFHHTGIARLVRRMQRRRQAIPAALESAPTQDCGCKRRREMLNQKIPYQR